MFESDIFIRKQIRSFSNVQQQQSTKVAHRTLKQAAGKNEWRESGGTDKTFDSLKNNPLYFKRTATK